MGGANAVLNVFDVQNYRDQEQKLEKFSNDSSAKSSYNKMS
jgi:Dynamin GTPase effector domain